MIRICSAFLLLAAFTGRAGAAEQGQLDASRTLFSVLAAINAAGYDAEIDSPANSPVRAMVREHLKGKNLPVMQQLKDFFEKHNKKDWTLELNQYISFALCVGEPPDFQYRYKLQMLPPDVTALEGFDTLMARFHEEAGIEELWQKAQPAFEEAIARYHQPVSQAVFEVNGYLRNPTSGYLGRQFQIYVDLLGAPNQVQTRQFAEDYFVVVTPTADPQIEDIRHAYLHYLVDPLVLKSGMELLKYKALGDYAKGSPILEEYYKTDFVLLATESLIKAVESRIFHGPAAKKQAMVDQAWREGFILTPHFAEQLPLYEKQEQALRLYFPDIVKAIDLKKEESRVANLEFATERPVRKVKVVPAERKVELTGFAKTLDEAERLYSERQLDKARDVYLQALRETDEKAFKAKAYYGLARIAALQKDPELALKLFEQTMELNPDPQVGGWTHVYLARLYLLSGEPDKAVAHFQAAAGLEGASAAARQAAEKALREMPK